MNLKISSSLIFISLCSSITIDSSLAFNVNNVVSRRHQNMHQTSRLMEHTHNSKRRNLILSAGGGIFGGMFNFGDENNASAASGNSKKSSGSTNEVVKVVNGIKQRRLGGSDIVVSELALGTQRWASDDFNAPSEQECMTFMDEAILKSGVNLLDTAEQYPIPSGRSAREGDTETLIGKWIKDRNVPREKVVIATKITGGR
jgi:hypothetical protein